MMHLMELKIWWPWPYWWHQDIWGQGWAKPWNNEEYQNKEYKGFIAYSNLGVSMGEVPKSSVGLQAKAPNLRNSLFSGSWFNIFKGAFAIDNLHNDKDIESFYYWTTLNFEIQGRQTSN